MENLLCWHCGESLAQILLPLSRREECPRCSADLHVCKLCRHYDPNISDQCREDRAEAFSDKERANFCDYLEPASNAYQGQCPIHADEARRQLADLFGDTLPDEMTDTSKAEQNTVSSESDKALEALRSLFDENK